MSAEFQLRIRAIPRVKGPMRKASMAVRAFSRELDKTKKSMKRFTDASKKIGKGFKNIGQKMTVGITTPVVAGIGASVKAFGDFDDGMRGVKTLLDENSFGAQTLSDGFKQMSKDVKEFVKTSPQGMQEITKALFDIVSATGDAKKAVDILRTADKLAVAGRTDVATSTVGLTKAFNAFGISTQKADTVASKFFTAQKRGTTTIAELSNFVGTVASDAASMGVSFEEVLASTVAATAGAKDTAQGFTGLRAILANVVKPTKDAKDVAKLLGFEFNSAAVRSKGFAAFLTEITSKAKSAGLPVSAVMEKLFGSVEALGVVQALTGKQSEKFRDVLGELGNDTQLLTTFNKAYEEQVASQNNRLKILRNRFSSIAITLGEKLAPHLEKLLMKVNAFLDRFETDKDFREFVIRIGTLATTMGPLLLVLSPVIGAFASLATLAVTVGKAIGGKGLLGIAKRLFGFFKKFAMRGGPLALVLLGLESLWNIAGELTESWEGVDNVFTEIFKRIVSGIAKTIDGITEMFGFETDLQSRWKNLFKDETKTIKVNTVQGTNVFQPLAGQFTPQGVPLSIARLPQNQTAPPTAQSGKANVLIDFKNMPSGVKVQTEKQTPQWFNLNVGTMGAGS